MSALICGHKQEQLEDQSRPADGLHMSVLGRVSLGQ
jgi:hypothetical protein